MPLLISLTDGSLGTIRLKAATQRVESQSIEFSSAVDCRKAVSGTRCYDRTDQVVSTGKANVVPVTNPIVR